MAEQNSTAREEIKRRRATRQNNGTATQVKAKLICHDFTRSRRNELQRVQDEVQLVIDQAAALAGERHGFDGCLIVLFGKERTICKSAGSLKDPAMATYHAMKAVISLLNWE